MDSSSIVSFNNDSTYQSTLKSDYDNISVHELALHAMRDRCLLLQRRINSLESDNIKLKLNITKCSEIPLRDDEKCSLHEKIAELNKQKSQLLHHLFMVSCENKNLWGKIAALKRSEKAQVTECAKQPLIRTNTYIHSTPKSKTQFIENNAETSLEEISLKLINSYIQEKSQLVEQYEQMAQLQNFEDDCILNLDSIGFNFMEDPSTDSLKEIQSQTEKLVSLKKEVSQQENDIKLILSRVESLLSGGYKCPTCNVNKGKGIIMEDKETEISNSLVNFATQTDSVLYDNFSEINTNLDKKSIEENEGNQHGLYYDKICPMCGETFEEDVGFVDFQSHVESHFIGVTEADSLENVDIQNSYDDVI